MGYYTSYNMEIETDPNSTKPTLDELEELTGYGWEELSDFEYRTEDDCKWYEHDEHMIQLSKKYSKCVFTLRGEGEETGDLWLTYYKDGKLKTYRPEIEFPPFDEDELEEPLKVEL